MDNPPARLRFGLDLDGVVYDWHSAFRFLANHQFNLNLPPVDELWPGWNGHRRYINKDQEAWLWDKGVKKGLFRHGHIRKGAVEAVRELAELPLDIVVITHRPPQARQDTVDWLSFHRIPVKELHMLNFDESKWPIKTDIFLDDKWENVVDYASNNREALVLLWDRAWNREWAAMVAGPRVYRADSWDKVIEWTKKELDFRSKGLSIYPQGAKKDLK